MVNCTFSLVIAIQSCLIKNKITPAIAICSGGNLSFWGTFICSSFPNKLLLILLAKPDRL